MAEYLKDNKKSKLPTSIRFNEAQLKIAMAKSGKKGRQQFIDWLIDWYINGDKSVIEKAIPIIQKSVETYVGIQDQLTKAEIQQPLDKESVYRQLINEAESTSDFKRIYKTIEADTMNFKIKTLLYEYWQKRKEEKGFIYND